MAVTPTAKNFTGLDTGAAPGAGQLSWALPWDSKLIFNKTDADAGDITSTLTGLVAGDEIVRGGDKWTVVSVVNATPIFTVTTSGPASKPPKTKNKAPVNFRNTTAKTPGVTTSPTETLQLNTQYEGYVIADQQARLTAGITGP